MSGISRLQWCRPYLFSFTVACKTPRLMSVAPVTRNVECCVFLFPTIHIALIDSDCVPVTLFETRGIVAVQWLPPRDAQMEPPHPRHSSPVAPAHKRARSVDTGRTAQQHGPPRKLSKSRSAENLASPTKTRLTGSHTPVDYRASDDESSAESSAASSTSLVPRPVRLKSREGGPTPFVEGGLEGGA